MVFELSFSYANMEANWRLGTVAGFNKAGRHRWEGNIFKALKDSGSFLDETLTRLLLLSKMVVNL
jgi:hypothetical protein